MTIRELEVTLEHAQRISAAEAAAIDKARRGG